MSKLSKIIKDAAARNGIELKGLARARRAVAIYKKNKADFIKQAAQSPNARDFPFAKDFPCLYDRDDTSGVATGHYFHQDLLIAQQILKHTPKRHIDVGSRVDGFVAHVATFREIEVVDIRQLKSEVPNIRFRQADMTEPMADTLGTADSVSCLHTLEHIGLGRYGDRIDPEGHLKGFANLTELVQPGGRFYFSTPIGHQRIEFDAHRVFSVPTLVDLVSKDFAIDRFHYVDDAGSIHQNIDHSSTDAAKSFACSFGCGIFELIRNDE